MWRSCYRSHNQAASSSKEVNAPNDSLTSLYKIIQKGWSHIEKWITFFLWVISVWLDPVMCYVLSIHDEEKLLKINSALMTVIWVLNWAILLYIIYITFLERKKEWKFFNGVESVALLVSSVLLYSLVFVPKMEISAPVFTFALVIFLLLYLLRVIGIYRLFTEEVTKISASKLLADNAFVKIMLNLQLFFYGGHLFGGLWYLFAIWKKLECWKKACSNHSGCHYANNRFNVISGDNKFLNDICFPEDTKIYELGIFKDAIEFRIVEMTTGLWRKFLYCFRWGIQNISGFGQNLQVGIVTWENIFVIFIAIYGVGTFTFFIGNMQNVIKSAIDKKSAEEKKQKEDQENKLIQRQPQQWLLDFEKLSEKLQNHIKQYNWQQTGGADVENLFSNRLKDVRNNITRELYLEMLKKVERFRRWSDASLHRLCDCVEPIVYAELTCIVHEGDPIDKMLFVLHGKLWNFSTNNVLKDGDFWGEELVNWVQDESSSSSLSSKILISLHLKEKKTPISHTTIKALTKVEAFVLRIDDLKKLLNEKAKILQSWFRKRKKRLRWMELLTAIKSNREQTPPGDQLTGPEIDV